MDVKFYRNPGFFYDLYNLFIMKLNNHTKWRFRVADEGYEENDMNYIEAYLAQFAVPEEELIVFFHTKDRKTNSYFFDVFTKILEKKEENMTLEDFVQYFEDEDKIRKELAAFYLGESVNYTDMGEVAEVLFENKVIKDDVKFQLLHFFTNAKVILGLLQKALREYAKMLEIVYRECYDKAEEAQKKFDFDELAEGVQRLTGEDISLKEEAKVSFVLISKNTVNICVDNDWYVLGYDYHQKIQNEFTVPISAEKIGNAMGDHNRQKMIEYIVEHGEQSSGELAKKLGMALNTVTYHLDIMRDAHLLCCRSVGKATFYWLNIRVLERFVDMLDTWIEIGGRKE